MNDPCVRLKHSHDSNVEVIVALSNDGIVGVCLYVTNCMITLICIFPDPCTSSRFLGPGIQHRPVKDMALL